MKNIKPHFVFSKQQRSGVFTLLLLIVVLQCVYYFSESKSYELSQVEYNQINTFQKEIDSLALFQKNKKYEIYPYNPNFISDYKGYALGMSIEEIDRLHVFRKMNKYVNSAKDFQRVTLVSDSLLKVLAVKFKFPDWVNKSNSKKKNKAAFQSDINRTSAKDILRVTGVNYKICYRIIDFRDKLGGFVQISQLQDVYGIALVDIEKITLKFQLKTIPEIKKINLNLANVLKLSESPYISEYLASNIVEERVLRDGFSEVSELKFVKSFPKDKFDHIKIYFTVN